MPWWWRERTSRSSTTYPPWWVNSSRIGSGSWGRCSTAPEALCRSHHGGGRRLGELCVRPVRQGHNRAQHHKDQRVISLLAEDGFHDDKVAKGHRQRDQELGLETGRGC